jgi:hypothetical protein
MRKEAWVYAGVPTVPYLLPRDGDPWRDSGSEKGIMVIKDTNIPMSTNATNNTNDELSHSSFVHIRTIGIIRMH